MTRSFSAPLATIFSFALICTSTSASAADASTSGLSQVLAKENATNGIRLTPMPVADDSTFLRRAYVDLIGRIPTEQEINHFAELPQQTRRAQLVDQLIQHERFADTWTAFYADMLRLRSNKDGGAAAIAFVHRAVQDGMPYDTLVKGFISANGKAGANPEVGFILGDNADPMALAGATAQVFLGVRVACAQCHDHPFDSWTQHDFYGLAAYFGKTRRIETNFTKTVYTTDVKESTVMWPPEGQEDGADRKTMAPRFPFILAKNDDSSPAISRLNNLRIADAVAQADQQAKPSEVSVDDLLSALDSKVDQAARGQRRNLRDVVAEAKRDARNLRIGSGIATESELRAELADLVTDPNNRYFSKCFVNRVWAHLIGRGIVEPIDDFGDSNPPSHPQTLDYLADEFVANGYDLKTLIRSIMISEPYQRSHASSTDVAAQAELEDAFLAAPMRRMLSEVIFDSVITAGHLFEVKHPAGQNLKTVWQQNRVNKTPKKTDSADEPQMAASENMMQAETKMVSSSSYDLENAIELDFDAILKTTGEMMPQEANVAIDQMAVMSKEELEAMRMQQQDRQRTNTEYIDRFVKATVDDNPKFTSSFRMASPAAPEHFLRVFGQTDRTQLGQHRDQSPSMRQALMMLNGRLTHEASRVGNLEPIHALLAGEQANLSQAIQLAYREILTRQPASDEIAEARAIIAEAAQPLEGMADLRWLLLNCDEFRFLP